jgi:hypothetical protein
MHTRKLLFAVLALGALAGAGACSDPFVPEHPTTVAGPSLDGIGFTGGSGRADTTTIPPQQQTSAGDPTPTGPSGIGFTGGSGD